MRSRITGVGTLLASLAHEPDCLRDVPAWLSNGQRHKDPLKHRRPWWNEAAIAAVGSVLPSRPRVFEFGGGASTLWLVDNGASVVTVESSAEWAAALATRIPAEVQLRLIEPVGADYSRYVGSIGDEADESFDLVVVDGRERVACGLHAMRKVKPGGHLLLDDSDRPRYQPLHDALEGWPAQHPRGLKSGCWEIVQTSIWRKPA